MKTKSRELKTDSGFAIIIMQKPIFDWVKREDGTSEFEDFVSRLNSKDKVKTLALIHRIEENGLEVSKKQKWIKKLDLNLYEIRFNGGFRIWRAIYFHVYQDKFLITHAFFKKTRKTPKKEINRAKNIRQKYLDERT